MSGDDSALEANRPLSGADDYYGTRCPECRGRLVVHQPDERLPHRLLGTCRSCLAWFLMDAAGGLVFRLPNELAPRDAGVIAGDGRADRPTAMTGHPHRFGGPEAVPKRRRAGRSVPTRRGGSPPGIEPSSPLHGP